MANFFFTVMDDLVYMFAVASIFRYNTLASRQLVDSTQSPASLFSMHRDELASILGMSGTVLEEFSNDRVLEESRKEIEWARSKGVKILSMNSDEYPRLLRECADAPIVLFYLGSADLNASTPVSIIGTRLASSYGREAAARVVQELYNGALLAPGGKVSIVSGLAYGIDIAAHKAALELGMDSVGVLPCGLDLIYPSGHREVAKKMVKQGGILTEFPHGVGVRRWQFIKRNRIIAGISSATVVAETRIKGGSMSTIEFANSYGRDVYAVPGRLVDSNSYGCNYLIYKNVAQIYTDEAARYICSGGMDSDSSFGGNLNLFSYDNANKEKILLSLKVNSLLDTDAICSAVSIPFDEASALLLEMELEGSIEMVTGKGYRIRNSKV